MFKHKILNTNKRIYYCGYISKYEQTEQAKAERRYMMLQKGLGIVAIILGIVMAKLIAGEALLLSFIGIPVTLTKDHVIG